MVTGFFAEIVEICVLEPVVGQDGDSGVAPRDGGYVFTVPPCTRTYIAIQLCRCADEMSF